MKIAIVHYHFKPGGVTRVVENAVAALGEHVSSVAICGECYTGHALSQTAVVQDMAYTQEGDSVDPVKLLAELKQAANQALGGAPDLWHIHNHSLGKNTAFADVVYQLAEEGTALLLQIHDFAEDGRPQNYQLISESIADINHLYPVGPRIGYAVLNGRDYALLSQAGIPEESLHLLPNPVSVPAEEKEEELPSDLLKGCGRLLLYPTRAIRRKNMGEFLLWSLLAEPGDLLASTLAPANPKALPIYERWKSLAIELQLPVRLGMGEEPGVSFTALMQRADAIMTTSVAEGFGLAFLEPWLWQKVIVGRDLPEVTDDFRTMGVQMEGLYRRLEFPVDWLGERLLRDELGKALLAYYERYGQALPRSAVDEAYGAIVIDGRVDFGRIDEALQERVIRLVAGDSGLISEISPGVISLTKSETTILQNQKVIEDKLNLEAYGRQLEALYRKLLASSEKKALDFVSPQRVLSAFLLPEHFSMLRT